MIPKQLLDMYLCSGSFCQFVMLTAVKLSIQAANILLWGYTVSYLTVKLHVYKGMFQKPISSSSTQLHSFLLDGLHVARQSNGTWL